MDANLLFICFLTLVIHVVGTLAYAVRIAGIRTRRIAISFSLFNILALISRTSNSFQGPFLAKRITIAGCGATIIVDARRFSVALSRRDNCDCGRRSIDSNVSAAVQFSRPPLSEKPICATPDRKNIQPTRSLLIRHEQARSITAEPPAASFWHRCINARHRFERHPMALWTLGVFASLYAGYLKPELRVTCSNLSSVINGLATILMFVFIDPQVSVMTDDVIEGRISDGRFRRAITSLLGARLAGTVLAQMLLLPSAALIMRVAEAI